MELPTTCLAHLALLTLLAGVASAQSSSSSAAAAAATTCQHRGYSVDNYCILTTEAFAPAAASYILSIDYQPANILFDPFQHIRSSLGVSGDASTMIHGPEGYSYYLASAASYVPESERGAWESVLRQALSLQTVTATGEGTMTTTPASGSDLGMVMATPSRTGEDESTETGASSTHTPPLYVSLIITPSTTMGRSMATQTMSAQQQQDASTTLSASTSRAAAAGSGSSGNGLLVAVAGAFLGAVGLVFSE